MHEITVPARTEMLHNVLEFVDGELERHGCPAKAQMQIDIAVEEIFVNIASYAYHPEDGEAMIRCEAGREEKNGDSRLAVTIQFLDDGRPYNPLETADPDVTLAAEERGIGGLGIYMVKKSMDGLDYEYKDGKNILTITKMAD